METDVARLGLNSRARAPGELNLALIGQRPGFKRQRFGTLVLKGQGLRLHPAASALRRAVSLFRETGSSKW
jgi:hypothetical protein